MNKCTLAAVCGVALFAQAALAQNVRGYDVRGPVNPPKWWYEIQGCRIQGGSIRPLALTEAALLTPRVTDAQVVSVETRVARARW
jgi:hypothetical protein